MEQVQRLNFKWSLGDLDRLKNTVKLYKCSAEELCERLERHDAKHGTKLASTPEEITDLCQELGLFIHTRKRAVGK